MEQICPKTLLPPSTLRPRCVGGPSGSPVVGNCWADAAATEKMVSAGACKFFKLTRNAMLYELDIWSKINDKEKADDIQTMRAWSEATKAKNALLWDEGGALHKKGTDAFGVTEEYEPELNKSFEAIEKDLTHDQKAMFAKMKSKRAAISPGHRSSMDI